MRKLDGFSLEKYHVSEIVLNVVIIYGRGISKVIARLNVIEHGGSSVSESKRVRIVIDDYKAMVEAAKEIANNESLKRNKRGHASNHLVSMIHMYGVVSESEEKSIG